MNYNIEILEVGQPPTSGLDFSQIMDLSSQPHINTQPITPQKLANNAVTAVATNPNGLVVAQAALTAPELIVDTRNPDWWQYYTLLHLGSCITLPEWQHKGIITKLVSEVVAIAPSIDTSMLFAPPHNQNSVDGLTGYFNDTCAAIVTKFGFTKGSFWTWAGQPIDTSALGNKRYSLKLHKGNSHD